MPGLLVQDAPFKTISVRELHSTYAAEVIGANFHDMSEEQLKEIKSAMAKVILSPFGISFGLLTYH